MIYSKFDQLIATVKLQPEKARCAVVSAEDQHTLAAIIKAYRENIVEPVLIGDKETITELLVSECFDWHKVNIIHEPNKEAAVQKAVDMFHEGKVQCIMKGLVETAVFMRVILKKENNLRTENLVSMLSIREMPPYHKLIAFTDAGICIKPTLDEKRQLIENAVETMKNMGFDTPKVAVLASVEVENPKMQESIDGAELKRMNQEGVIKDCIVEGPISFDIAVRKDAAEIKGFESTVAGDADLLVFPDLVSANITTKAISMVSGIPSGSMILGTKVPVIMTSRSSSTETKYLCIAMAVAGI